jgi:hypothetical protein
VLLIHISRKRMGGTARGFATASMTRDLLETHVTGSCYALDGALHACSGSRQCSSAWLRQLQPTAQQCSSCQLFSFAAGTTTAACAAVGCHTAAALLMCVE